MSWSLTEIVGEPVITATCVHAWPYLPSTTQVFAAYVEAHGGPGAGSGGPGGGADGDAPAGRGG
jgi:hypothetical protein